MVIEKKVDAAAGRTRGCFLFSRSGCGTGGAVLDQSSVLWLLLSQDELWLPFVNESLINYFDFGHRLEEYSY